MDWTIDMKKIIAVITCIAAALLSGCGGSEKSVPTEITVEAADAVAEEQAGVFPVTLSDGTVIASAPDSIASLSPALTEIIAELGYDDKLCAVSRYCDYPENVCSVTVGSSENPDVDKLVELAPDVLFTLTELSEREEYALEAAGITIVKPESPSSVEDYGGLYGVITAVFEGEEAGDAAAQKACESLESAAEAAEFGGGAAFLYISPKLTAAGSGTFESAVLSLCGSNVCTAEGYAETVESITADPQYIIAADSLTEDDIASSEAFGAYAAAATIIFVPAERFERPSARLAEIFSAKADES